MNSRRVFVSAAVAFSMIVLAGCASQPKSETKTAAADAAEYEWVKPLGSNIAVKVRKGTTARTAVAPSASITGEELSQTVSSVGGKPPSDMKGGAN